MKAPCQWCRGGMHTASSASRLFEKRGLMLLLGVGASLDPRWIVGPYALVFAMTRLALTLRLHQLAYEMAAS